MCFAAHVRNLGGGWQKFYRSKSLVEDKDPDLISLPTSSLPLIVPQRIALSARCDFEIAFLAACILHLSGESDRSLTPILLKSHVYQDALAQVCPLAGWK